MGYEPSPHPTTQTIILSSNEEVDDVVEITSLVLGLQAISENLKALTDPSAKLPYKPKGLRSTRSRKTIRKGG